MFKRLLKNKKAQQTAEYALLIALVVAAVIAMQTYVQRAFHGRMRDASLYLRDETNALGSTSQYEPYYLVSQYTVNRSDTTTETLGQRNNTSGIVAMNVASNRTRAKGGFQNQAYNETGLPTGI